MQETLSPEIAEQTPDPDYQEIGKRTARSGVWVLSARMVSRLFDLGTMIVLAHLLHPRDFGLVAIAMSLIYIVEAALELPISNALVRLDTLTESHFDTAFTLGLVRAFAVGAMVCAVSWPFAHYYKEAELIPLICSLSLAPASRGFVSPRMAVYAKKLDFSRDFKMELIGKVCAFALSITLAITTRSYWAIAAGTIMSPLGSTIASYFLAPYRPRLSFSQLPSFTGFLGWITAAQVIGAVNWQSDRLLLGKLTSHASLGLFSAANDTATIPLTALLGPVIRPLLSAFSAVRNDKVRAARSYKVSSSAIMTVALPILIGQALVAEAAVRIMFGERWAPAAPLLRFLSLSLIPSVYAAAMPPLVMAFDKTEIFFKRNLLEISVKLPLLVYGALHYGFAGVIGARAVSETCTAIFAMFVARRLTGVSFVAQLLAPWRSFVSSAAMALVVYAMLTGLHQQSSMVLFTLHTVAIILIGSLTYCGTLFLLWRMADRPTGIEAMVMNRAAGLLRANRYLRLTESS
jgi:O-antigen/teichoic acid export membrane protein